MAKLYWHWRCRDCGRTIRVGWALAEDRAHPECRECKIPMDGYTPKVVEGGTGR